jgi:assimilatory nitrate reductase catalytic subunit
VAETRSTCCYCGVGCGVVIEHEADADHRRSRRPEHPANFGKLCSKGSTPASHRAAAAQRYRARSRCCDRRRGLPLRTASWDEALDTLADGFAACIRAHGPDSVAFYVSGQLLTEDYYVFNKLAKGLVGTNNIDTNSRLCMSSAVTGYKATLGADAPPACYEDIDHADLIFIAGSNMAWAHPVLFRRIEAGEGAQSRAEDRRRRSAPHRDRRSRRPSPGDRAGNRRRAVSTASARDAVGRWIDAATSTPIPSGLPALKTRIRSTRRRKWPAFAEYAWRSVTAARWFGEAKAVLSLYCQGLNQSSSGTAKNAALINLHLATGQVGRPAPGRSR